MRTTFEKSGTIIDIGHSVLGDLDTTDRGCQSPPSPAQVAISVYQRDLGDAKTVRFILGVYLDAADARSIATVLAAAADGMR